MQIAHAEIWMLNDAVAIVDQVNCITILLPTRLDLTGIVLLIRNQLGRPVKQ